MASLIPGCLLVTVILVSANHAHPTPSSSSSSPSSSSSTPYATSSSSSTKCNKMPASEVYQGTCYFQYAKGRGFVRRQCPSGTLYNSDACACVPLASALRKRFQSRDDDDDDDRRESAVSVLSILQHKARILRGLLSKAPAAILRLRHIFNRIRGGRGGNGDDDDDNEKEKERGDERGFGGRSAGDDDEKEGSRSLGKNILGLLARRVLHPGSHSYLSAYQHKPQIPRNLFDIFNFGKSGRQSVGSAGFGANRGGDDDDDGMERGDDDFGGVLGGKGAALTQGLRRDDDGDDDVAGKSTRSGGTFAISGSAGVKGIVNFPGILGRYGDIDDMGDDRGFGPTGNDDDREDGVGGLDKNSHVPASTAEALSKIRAALGSGAHSRNYGFGEDDREEIGIGNYGDDDNDDDNVDDDNKSGEGNRRHGYLSPYSVKGMLTRNKDYHFGDLLSTIFNHDDDDDDLSSHDDDDDDDEFGSFENDIFDDYEDIYQKKFDGVLEYVNKISNDIFDDDFDDFYEDLFDDDGYDDCFVKKYEHYFSDDFEDELDDKYEEFEEFFSRDSADRGDDTTGDDYGQQEIDDDVNTGAYSKRGDGGDSLKDDSTKDGSNRDDDSLKEELDGDDSDIWSGRGKFAIYDNLFGSLRKSGTQDSRLFNFGDTLKGKGSSSPTLTSDDGGEDIFDAFYKDRALSFLRDYRR